MSNRTVCLAPKNLINIVGFVRKETGISSLKQRIPNRYYVEMQGKPGVPLEEVSNSLSKIAAAFVDEALEPEHWGMKRVTLA